MSLKETETDYAFWRSPDQSLTVTYSLEQFHEIDFQANEGFRRIPHGGIEIGGLLYGKSDAAEVSIRAFRQIECEHATGPSFVLSERDLELLEAQIKNSAADPELHGLQVVGWFIAHTRTPLRLSDRETAIFERFFPRREQITLLVKPERFQPTRFGFFARKPDGSLEHDATNSAIILPLPGRTGRNAGGPVASIPAPTEKPAVPAPVERTPRSPAMQTETPKAPPSPTASMNAAAIVPPVPPPPAEQPQPPNWNKTTRIRPSATPIEPPAPVSSAPPASELETETALATIPKENKLPTLDEIHRKRIATLEGRREMGALDDEGSAYHVRLVLILLLAAFLGCAAGYWGYRELPSPVVPLAVRSTSSGLVVTWPNEQTRGAGYAAIRVNDGAQQPLSTEEKMAGAAQITPPSPANVKVELIVQHWMRDSRGIVRYVGAIAPPAR